MNETIISAQRLRNDLTLEMIDISKPLVGNRWYVGVLARIKIPTDALQRRGSGDNQPSAAEIRRLLGDAIYFEQKQERNFIAESERDSVRTELIESYLNTAAGYLSHPDFPRRYVMKTYAKRKQQEALLKASSGSI